MLSFSEYLFLHVEMEGMGSKEGVGRGGVKDEHGDTDEELRQVTVGAREGAGARVWR